MKIGMMLIVSENYVNSITKKCEYAPCQDKFVEALVRWMSYQCSICGKTVIPKRTKIDTGWDLSIDAYSPCRGAGGKYKLDHVCKECSDKEREARENAIYRAYAASHADILSGT